MITNAVKWRDARPSIRQHGEQAAIKPAMRTDQLVDHGDIDGQRVWLHIREAIHELQHNELMPVERTH